MGFICFFRWWLQFSPHPHHHYVVFLVLPPSLGGEEILSQVKITTGHSLVTSVPILALSQLARRSILSSTTTSELCICFLHAVLPVLLVEEIAQVLPPVFARWAIFTHIFQILLLLLLHLCLMWPLPPVLHSPPRFLPRIFMRETTSVLF